MQYRVVAYQPRAFGTESGLMTSGELSHHGILGMKWGVRRYQNSDGTLTAAGKLRYGASKVGESVSNAATKAGTSIKKAYNAQVEKSKADRAKRKAREDAEKADLEKRKADAAKRAKLMKMAKKHPELLTYQELQDLNNRAQQESNFKKNYPEKTKAGKNAVNKTKNTLVSEVIKPGFVALGKSAVMSFVGGGDFQKIASYQLGQAYNKSNQSNNNQNNQNQGSQKFKKKKGSP